MFSRQSDLVCPTQTKPAFTTVLNPCTSSTYVHNASCLCLTGSGWSQVWVDLCDVRQTDLVCLHSVQPEKLKPIKLDVTTPQVCAASTLGSKISSPSLITIRSCSHIVESEAYQLTVEPPNKGTGRFVLHWEVVLFLEVKYLLLWKRDPEGCLFLEGPLSAEVPLCVHSQSKFKVPMKCTTKSKTCDTHGVRVVGDPLPETHWSTGKGYTYLLTTYSIVSHITRRGSQVYDRCCSGTAHSICVDVRHYIVSSFPLLSSCQGKVNVRQVWLHLVQLLICDAQTQLL